LDAVICALLCCAAFLRDDRDQVNIGSFPSDRQQHILKSDYAAAT
jgi:hypothetical protein